MSACVMEREEKRDREKEREGNLVASRDGLGLGPSRRCRKIRQVVHAFAALEFSGVRSAQFVAFWKCTHTTRYCDSRVWSLALHVAHVAWSDITRRCAAAGTTLNASDVIHHPRTHKPDGVLLLPGESIMHVQRLLPRGVLLELLNDRHEHALVVLDVRRHVAQEPDALTQTSHFQWQI